jgi:hypothetical protein
MEKVRKIDKLLDHYNWFIKHRPFGIPFELRADKDYLDWYYKWRPQLFQYQDIHKGEDCFIIGNGPSLNKTDLSLLADYHTFGLNKIYMIFEKYKFDLSYHVCVNPLVIEQMQEQFDNDIYKCPSFLSYIASKEYQYKNEKVNKILTNARWSFYDNILEPFSEGFTVTYVAMQIAYYMGFKNVFLVGVDHNFQQSGNANEEQLHKGDDVNHFHPDYFKGMQWHLADLEGNEASYALAKHQFHAAGKGIYDATVDGKLTIFPKISFDDAVSLAKKRE